MQGTILIVDDEKHTREGLRQSLEDDFDVYTASNIDEATNVLNSDQIDLVLTDLRLGGEDGMVLIEQILRRPRPPVCILMTAYGSIATAVEAMKRGAHDFVTKPVNIDELGIKIERAIEGRKTEQENVQLRQQVETRFGLENIIGQSKAMHRIFEIVRQVAPTQATVLILGESGTGKELIAHAIHNLSNRNKTRFVAFNCSAFSPQLIESELFGHERGAFTGAVERRLGRFEQAAGGTLFLDEIGEIDANVQVKLLRALDPGVFERVGGNQPIRSDVRLIAATNRDLAAQVREGKFREDLYYRLNVINLALPPLRERKEDIPLLVDHFFTKYCRENEKFLDDQMRSRLSFEPEAMQILMDHTWPGNVRELENVIERAVVLASQTSVPADVLPEHLLEARGLRIRRDESGGLASDASLFEIVADFERRTILEKLDGCEWSQTATAEAFHIPLSTLNQKIKRLNIDVRKRGAQ